MEYHHQGIRRRKKLTNFHLNKFKKLFVVNHVNFVHENNDGWNTNLTSKKDVLTSLWHRTISSSNNKDSTIHLSSTSNHVFYVVSVTWTVNVSVVTVLSFILNVRSSDSDTTLFFFWSVIDLIKRHSFCHRILD